MIKVRVFYDSLRYTEIREFSLLSFDSVLSQLGGIVGLWLEFSVYSIVKVIDKAWQWHEQRRTKKGKVRSALEMLNHQTFGETPNIQ